MGIMRRPRNGFNPFFRLFLFLANVLQAGALQGQSVCHSHSDPICAHRLGVRFGEAQNPGPISEEVSIFATNPTGLRGKEAAMIEHGEGIYLIAETQLSAVSQKSSGSHIFALGRSCSRRLRTHFGAPAPLRSHSEWAGSWTGVATIGDYASRPVGIARGYLHLRQGRNSATPSAFRAIPHSHCVWGPLLAGPPEGMG